MNCYDCSFEGARCKWEHNPVQDQDCDCTEEADVHILWAERPRCPGFLLLNVFGNILKECWWWKVIKPSYFTRGSGPEHPVHFLKLYKSYFPRASGSHSTVSVSLEQTLPQVLVWRRATPLRSSRCCPSCCFISSCFIPCSCTYYSSCSCPCWYCVLPFCRCLFALILFWVFCVRSSREELPVARKDLLRIVSYGSIISLAFVSYWYTIFIPFAHFVQ